MGSADKGVIMKIIVWVLAIGIAIWYFMKKYTVPLAQIPASSSADVSGILGFGNASPGVEAVQPKVVSNPANVFAPPAPVTLAIKQASSGLQVFRQPGARFTVAVPSTQTQYYSPSAILSYPNSVVAANANQYGARAAMARSRQA
jgi:hypothetical protein